MVFSSYEFLLLFLPIVATGYFLLSRFSNVVYQKLFLVGASLFFYGYYNAGYLLLILGSVLANYWIAVWIQKLEAKKNRCKSAVLACGILFNVGLIGTINILISSSLR